MLRYAITSRVQYAETEPERHATLVAQAARLAAEGVEYIQLREKDLAVKDLIGLAREIVSVIRNSGSGSSSETKLLINSRADVALACGAEGVHLPSSEEQLTPRQIRRLFAAAGTTAPVVSVSCHSIEDVTRAKEGGADLILFGPVFGKSDPSSGTDKVVVPGTGIEALKAACEAAGATPVLALGGVTASTTAACVAAGASGIAAIRLFR